MADAPQGREGEPQVKYHVALPPITEEELETAIDEECGPEEEKPPRRYEIVNAETGEPVQGVSFILTPTGEEMHMLTPWGKYVGPMQDIGIYYHGKTTGELTGAASFPSIKPMALGYIGNVICRELVFGVHEARKKYALEELRRLGEKALQLYEKHRPKDDGQTEAANEEEKQ